MARTYTTPKRPDLNINYSAYPAARDFHASTAFMRVLLGPVGGGKSSATWMELFRRACEEHPDDRGVRSSHHLCVRDTYAMLKATTIKDFLSWFGRVGEVVYDSPIRGRVSMPLPDGTTLDWNMSFMSLDGGDKSLDALRGMQITGAYVNEGHSVSRDVYDVITTRVGRYRPAGRDPKWKGIVADSNFGHQGCYLHSLYMNPTTEVEMFEQPPAAFWNPVTNRWVLNPHCDNLEHLPGGLDYYQKMLGMDTGYIKQFLANQWAVKTSGKQIYPEYSPQAHLVRGTIQHDPRLPLIIGMDFGLHVAAAFNQLSPMGKLMTFRELWDDDTDLETFLDRQLVPTLRSYYPGVKAIVSGDPSGMGRSALDKRTAFAVLKSRGLMAFPAVTNDPVKRWGSVRYFLTRNNGYGVHHSCKRMVEGFEGGYGYRKKGPDEYADEAEKNVYSHCFVADTPVSTARGKVRIADVVVGDLATTRVGWCVVTATMSRNAPVSDMVEVELSTGDRLVCTADHPFILACGVRRADALQYGDILQTEDSTWSARNSTDSPMPTTMGAATSAGKSPEATAPPDKCTCTSPCGTTTTGAYFQVGRFTTSTTTHPTTTSGTLCASTTGGTTDTTPGSITRAARSSGGLKVTSAQKGCAWRLNGMARQRGTYGTSNMQKTSRLNGRWWSRLWMWCAATAARLIKSSPRSKCISSAQNRAAPQHGSSPGLMMSRCYAKCAAPRSPPTSTSHEVRVVAVVPWKPREGQESVRVYDLTVEGAHEFYAAGVLVHNCLDAQGYACLYARFGAKQHTDPMKHLAEMRKAEQARTNGRLQTGPNREFFWA